MRSPCKVHTSIDESEPHASTCSPLGLRLADQLFGVDWVVYAKPPFGGPEQVYAYLGRYTHRVGLSNHRLRAIDDEHVTFVGKDHGLVRVTPHEFIRRFLQHVLPRDFVKLRHYGLLSAGHATTLLEVARQRLGGTRPEPLDDLGWRDRLFRLTGIDLRICPRCSKPTRARVQPFFPARLPWSEPTLLDSS